MRKICVVTGTRAEYGVMKPFLTLLQKEKGVQLQLVVTAMHLLQKFGHTVDLVKKDGFTIAGRVPMFYEDDTALKTDYAVARGIRGFAQFFSRARPDILVLEADRLEMLAACIASLPFTIPIVHISGGDVSGGLDDSIRHAISRFSHLHLTNSRRSSKRLVAMGEESWRVRYIGTLAVSRQVLAQAASPAVVAGRLGLNLQKAVFVVIQHPVLAEADHAGRQMKEVLAAVGSFQEQTVVLYPNNDLGSAAIIREIVAFKKNKFAKVIRNIDRGLYLGLVRQASVVIGNSSSGIVEAPFFGTPVVNIGTRQQGRERARNVIDTGYSRTEIQKAIRTFGRRKFRRMFGGNPYRDMRTEETIVRILKGLKPDARLMNKRLAY